MPSFTRSRLPTTTAIVEPKMRRFVKIAGRCFSMFIFIISLPQSGYASVQSEAPKSFCEHLDITSAHLKIRGPGCRIADSSWLVQLNKLKNFAEPITVQTTPLAQSKVLILSPKWSSAYDVASKTIIEEFHSRGVTTEFILFNYRGDTAQAKAIIKSAEAKGVDLIFSMGSATTAFMTEYYKNGAIPVVSACSKDPVAMNQIDADVGMSQHNIAYTSLNISVETQVAYLKEKFLSGLNLIAIIYDRNNPSSIRTQVNPLKEYLDNSDTGIRFELIEVDFSQINRSLYQPMRRFVAHKGEEGDRVFLVTGSTELFDVIEDINVAAKDVPVLSVTPSHVMAGDHSVFMAIGVSFKTNAKLAADYAFRILKGQSQTQTLAVGVVSTPDIAINFKRKPLGSIKVPFNFFEDAFFIFNYDGIAVRADGKSAIASH